MTLAALTYGIEVSPLIQIIAVRRGCLLWRWCVLSENIVPRFDRLVARKAGFQIGLGVNLPVFKLSKSPAARRCILF